jgi:predicted ATPase/DNA-binding SARP family transcriptional activator/Tfp pilus assembly protein PilF
MPDTSRPPFRLLGSVVACDEGHAADLGAPKQRLLLSLLLLNANTAVSREAAVDCLWPDAPPERSGNALQVYVHNLRRALGRDRIVTRGTGYLLRADVDEIDASAFERRFSEARAALATGDPAHARALLDEALGLWQGEPLADLPFVPFVGVERERLEELRLLAEEQRFEACLALGDESEIVPALSAFVCEHPFRERAWGQLMRALYGAGRQADALDTYRRARAVLDEELGVEPGPDLRELERAILRHDPSLSRGRAATPGPQLALPRPATPLVGRAAELAAVAGMFEEGGARLVTLIGPGGVGKTRLAIAAAERLGVEPSDGAVFVDLANLVDAALVPSALASAAGIAERGEDPVSALTGPLAGSDLLFVVDNFEHVIDAAPAIAKLLAGSPGVRVIATSRTPLRLGAESLFTVSPLAVPDGEARLDELAVNDAVTVFVARARAIDDAFRLTEANGRDVAEICRLLDGMPLAIELAAARTKLLAPAEIVTRLARPLELLTGGNRDLPLRHQTLRATIEWSYGLLEPAERELFARLSVFAGGCTLDAVEAVCGTELDALAGLLDHSLVRREQEHGRAPRFRLLATIRDFADERLVGEERGTLRRAHARYFLELAETTREVIAGSGAQEAELLALLELDHDNYRAALRYAVESGDAEMLLRLVTALRLLWMVRGHLAEGRAWFEAALDAPGAREAPHRADALSAGGILVYRAGSFDLARRWWEEARDRFEQAGDVAGLARTLGHLAGIAHAEGDLDLATVLWEASARELRELGDDMRLAIALGNLGVAATSRGRYDEAARYLEEALALARRAENWITECSILFNLGRAVCELGEVEHARSLFRDGLRIADQLGYRELVAYTLLGLADVAAFRGEISEARDLLAACDRLAGTLGIRFQGDELTLHERTVERLGPPPPETDAEARADVEATVAAALAGA